MIKHEINPSFSLKYLILTAITAAIISGVGFGISKIYESRPIKEITVTSGYLLSLINDSYLPKEKFDVVYYLKGKKRTKILSLFRKKVIIKNTGNKGVQNLSVTAILRGEGIKLVSLPKIKTIPIEVIDTIKVEKNNSSTDNKHIWNISLLNPGESITFEYSAFSKDEKKSISLDVIPRKKDWRIIYEELTLPDKKYFTDIFATYGGLLILILLLPLLIAFPFYRYQWARRADYREKYRTFWKFYNKHTPWSLFSSKHQDANK